MGRIFITGDKHRTFVPLFWLAEKENLDANDVLMIAGDAGYVWDEDYPHDIESLQQIFPGTITFVDGNHENHFLLNQMPVEIWNGGKVHRVGTRVLHLMRGEIYSIENKTFFVFGGAKSSDRDRRQEGESWWKEEEPTPQEVAYGRERLERHQNEIQYIITHEAPRFVREHIAKKKSAEQHYAFLEELDQWYAAMAKKPQFQKWYFGHMHVDQVITDQLQGVYHQFLKLDDLS